MEVNALIKGSRLIEPPWPEDAWEAAGSARNAGTGALFDFWQLGAPAFLDFINE
jgi:2-hydroxy-6-oxonona-2,4-dienedioate hydrolase